MEATIQGLGFSVVGFLGFGAQGRPKSFLRQLIFQLGASLFVACRAQGRSASNSR